MLTKITELLKTAQKEIQKAPDVAALKEIETHFLGRKGELSLLLRDVSTLPENERGAIGKAANDAKKEMQVTLEARFSELERAQEGSLAETEWIDVSLPGKKSAHGKRHPIPTFIREVEEVFARLGFIVADGPEIEDDWHNFTALNVVEDHPAREMQATFWLDEPLKGMVLRTQTSGIQIRYMEKNKPPMRIIAPGKVYRKDSDATHSPMFHQYEGLLVDRNVSLANLKFVLLSALRSLISPDIELRFRLSFFPFTEPSVEVDALLNVEGKRRWLEVGGAGMIHPNVLKNSGLNPEEWNGFAFGMGIERLIMIKYGIGDLRLFFENDLRFLKQFA
jgi:phenylalanyl-tRNA synthetase alpha chain